MGAIRMTQTIFPLLYKASRPENKYDAEFPVEDGFGFYNGRR